MSGPRYGVGQLRGALGAFARGRLLGAVAGLAVLLLLVRVLERRDYGAYFTCYAYLELMLLLAGWGLLPLLERLAPELHATHQDHELARLAPRLLGLRAALLALMLVPAWFAREPLLGWLALPLAPASWALVQGLVWIESLCRGIDSLHESLLLQRRAQRSILLRHGLKALLLVGLVAQDRMLPLLEWLQLELLLWSLGLAFSLWGLRRTWRELRQAPVQAPVPPTERGRMWRFALYSHAGGLVALLASADLLRISVNRVAGLEEAARFGFCLALALVVQRYLPAHLLGGLLRPLFVVARQREDALPRLRDLLGLCLKLNLLPLLPLGLLAVVRQDAFVALVSGGRFGAAQGLLAGLVLLLLLQAARALLQLGAHALEDARGAWIAATLAALVFVPLVLGPWLASAATLLVGLMAAELAAVVALDRRLAAQQLRTPWPWRASLHLLGVNLLVLVPAEGLAQLLDWPAPVAIGVDALACALACGMLVRQGFFEPAERARLRALWPGQGAAA